MTAGTIAIFAALTNMQEYLPHILYVNTTESLPVGFYVAIPGGEFRNGDLVAYKPTSDVLSIVKENDWYQKDTANLIFIKRAYSNIDYKVIANSITVAGKTVGKVYEKDTKGHLMPQHQGYYRVGKNEFLPLGDSERSFDGRYTGTVEKKRIVTRVVPFLTF